MVEKIYESVIKALETSLINFLLQKRDIEDRVMGGARRVRSLEFSIKTDNPKKPLFIVSIGMCACQFNALNGLKEQGSIFGLERYIRDWFERPSVHDAIKAYIYNDRLTIREIFGEFENDSNLGDG